MIIKKKSIVSRQGAPKDKTHQCFWGLKSQIRHVLSAGKYGIDDIGQGKINWTEENTRNGEPPECVRLVPVKSGRQINCRVGYAMQVCASVRAMTMDHRCSELYMYIECQIVLRMRKIFRKFNMR